MDSAARSAYIVAQAACMNAEIAAMKAENYIAGSHEQPLPHNPNAFRDLPRNFGLMQNQVISFLRGE